MCSSDLLSVAAATRPIRNNQCCKAQLSCILESTTPLANLMVPAFWFPELNLDSGSSSGNVALHTHTRTHTHTHAHTHTHTHAHTPTRDASHVHTNNQSYHDVLTRLYNMCVCVRVCVVVVVLECRSGLFWLLRM